MAHAIVPLSEYNWIEGSMLKGTLTFLNFGLSEKHCEIYWW